MKLKVVCLMILILTIALLLGSRINTSINVHQHTSLHASNLNTEVVGGLTDHSIYLKPNNTGKTQYVIYTGSYSGFVKLKAYRVPEVGSTTRIATKHVSVSIDPSEAKLKPHKKYTFNVTVKANTTGSYTFLICAKLGNKTIKDWLRVLVSQNPNPGFKSLYLPRVKCVRSITLKAGEKAEENYYLYTGESPPGIVKVEVYRVKCLYSTKKLPIQGLNVSIIPAKRLVSPRTNYTFRIIVKANRSLTGKYIFCINLSGVVGIEKSWLVVNVI